MKAIRLHARGGPESLRFEDAPTPRLLVANQLLLGEPAIR
jgi:hypothetical protein